MNDRNQEQNEDLELDLRRLIGALKEKCRGILLAAVLSGAAALLGTLFFAVPQYQSSVMFYVNNSPLTGASQSLTSSDLVTARDLVDSYLVILQTREALLEIRDCAGVDRTDKELRKMITAEAVGETEFFQAVVTSPDPYEAEKIADAIAGILPGRIAGIVEGSSAKVVDAAAAASEPSSPSYGNNTLLGLAAGLALSMGAVLLQEILDVSIRTPEDVRLACPYPILTAVPDMDPSAKGGGRKTKKSGGKYEKKSPAAGGFLPFAALEAYKLLRTKLQFSFAEEPQCRVIGISSALSGEGKSLSAVSLAHCLSQLNKKVLLVDCDLRRPSLSAKLPVRKMPGLSDFLTGQNGAESMIQPCGLPGGERAFSVIASGRTPPNPMELLSAPRMQKVLNLLRRHYNYILLDLPPVGEVGDALTIAGEVDGFLLVVRQNHCSRAALKEAVRQFESVDARILGIVYNGATETLRGCKKEYGIPQGRYLHPEKRRQPGGPMPLS